MIKFFSGIIIILFGVNVFASNVSEEALSKASFGIPIYQENDSTIIKELDKIQKLFDDRQYSQALELALKLDSQFYNSMPNEFYKLKLIIGDVYSRTNNTDKSLDYYHQSKSILESNVVFESGQINNIDEEYAKVLLRIGYDYQKRYFRNKNNDIKLKDSAIHYYNKVESFNSLNPEILRYQAITYTNLSGIFQADSLFDQSIVYANKAIDIHRKQSNKISEAKALNNLANIFLMQGDFSEAKKVYSQGIELIKNNESTSAIKLKGNLHYNLAWAMRNLKEYEAYDKLEVSYDIQTNLRDIEYQTAIEEINAQHNVANVKKEEQIKRQRANTISWVIGISSVSVIIFLGFVLTQYRLRQKNLKLRLSTQELEKKRELDQLKADTQIRILNATIDGKETERKQIAETLHDNVSALLSSANLHLQACKKQFNGNTPIEVDKSQDIITEASQKIRDLSHTLVSSILLKFGLAFSIKDLAKKYSNSQISIATETKNIRRYHQNFEIKMDNIIKEFVNNILKHSEATEASIFIEDLGEEIELIIQDNGKGFDKTKITAKDGLGINQIDARIQMMHGNFFIDSKKGLGTKIFVTMPIVEKEEVIAS